MMTNVASILAPYIFAGGRSSGSSDDGAGAVRKSCADEESEFISADSVGAVDSVDAIDIELSSRIRDGDTDAMRTLVLNYADRLTRFAYTLLKSRDEAEEIAYDVLANVWQQKKRLKPNRSLKAYLFAGVRHRALDKLAHEQVRQRHAVRVSGDLRSQLGNSVLTPEEVLFAEMDEQARNEQIRSLREAISTLSARHQLGLHLRFEQGLSYPEMGRVMNISDKAAQQIVLRAIGTLRRLLEV